MDRGQTLVELHDLLKRRWRLSATIRNSSGWASVVSRQPKYLAESVTVFEVGMKYLIIGTFASVY